MTFLSAPTSSQRPRTGRIAQTYAALALAGLAALVLGHLALFGMTALSAGLPAVAVYGLASLVIAWHVPRVYPHPLLGLCNGVTQGRLVLVGLVASSLLVHSGGHWITFALAATALLLDGLDGWLARREGLASTFGARFDMEVDSALALILALGAFAQGTAGPFVLLLGLARYGFWGASLRWPWLNGPLPERFSRKAICVMQIGTLVALQAPGLPPALAQGAVLGVGAALCWSFGRDILLLRRGRRAGAVRG